MSLYARPDRWEQIDDLGSCLLLHSELVSSGHLSPSEWDRLRFWTARSAALRLGRNKPALWRWLLTRSELPGSLADEDMARVSYEMAKALTEAPAGAERDHGGISLAYIGVIRGKSSDIAS